MLTIAGKTLGKKKPLFADWSMELPPGLDKDDGGCTLRDLITSIVASEVSAFRGRQDEKRLVKVLAAADIEKGAVRGKIAMGGEGLKQEVDTDAAIATALQAFEDGLYLVVLDDEEQRELDRQIHLRDDSRVTFIRLAMLAGG